MKKKYWVSWYGCWETLGLFTLYTPWWESGYTMDEPERQTICAAVWADDEEEVKEIIYGCYENRPDPGEIEFRFINHRHADWDPRESERFPFGEWMEPYWQRGEYRQEKHDS